MLKKILVMIAVMLLLVLIPSKSVLAKTLTIAVIDTGIDKTLPNLCRMGHKSFVKNPLLTKDSALEDKHGHGTHVSGIINSNAGLGNYCLVAIKYYSELATGAQNLDNMIKALRYAINIKVNFINISGGGPIANDGEKALIKEALDKGIVVVVAAGNEHDDLDKNCNYFPACYDKRLVVVGNMKQDLPTWANNIGPEFARETMHGDVPLSRSPSSNYGDYVTRWEVGTDVLSTLPGGGHGYMSGTSQATAVATGKLVRAKLKK